MCGRINLQASPVELAEFFELFREPVWTGPRYNIGPMQSVLAVRQQADGLRVAEPLQWGLVPCWAKDPSVGSKMIIARSDTIATKPAYRAAFRERRCLIAATGFYEWQIINSKSKQPWHIFRADGKPIALAGLWEEWHGPQGEVLQSCSIVTTDPNQFTAEFHDRMPVVLAKKDWAIWLDPACKSPDVLEPMLGPCPEDWLNRTAVSSFVNSVQNDSPECIKPIKADRLLF